MAQHHHEFHNGCKGIICTPCHHKTIQCKPGTIFTSWFAMNTRWLWKCCRREWSRGESSDRQKRWTTSLSQTWNWRLQIVQFVKMLTVAEVSLIVHPYVEKISFLFRCQFVKEKKFYRLNHIKLEQQRFAYIRKTIQNFNNVFFKWKLFNSEAKVEYWSSTESWQQTIKVNKLQ